MKKVLIISYYWPKAGGPGVQRWLKFATYFRSFGIEPILYVPKNPNYPIIDEQLLQEVPQGITVLKQNIWEPYGLARIFSRKKTKKISAGVITEKKQSIIEKVLLWIRGNLFIPDARVFWVKPSVRFLTKYIKQNNIDTVITTGPPHSLHLIGLDLQQRNNVFHIADFRDPWTTIGYHKKLRLSAYAQKKHKSLEKRVLDNASLITVTSATTKKEFQALTKTPIQVVTNGYDTRELTTKPMDKKFSIVHIGSLLSGRNPILLWQVLAELVQENPKFAQDLALHFIGTISKEVIQTIADHDLSSYVTDFGYVSHQKALEKQQTSQVLLLLEIDSPDTCCIIPGKLFEYMSAKRPILALGPKGSDIAPIIHATNTGAFFTYQQKQALKTEIKRLYKAYQAGTLEVLATDITSYSRKELTKKMAAIILKHTTT